MIDDQYEMYKIVVIGDSNTGKTNIIRRFVQNKFKVDTHATLGVEFLPIIITMKNKKIKITFWDTAGQERYRGAAGVIIVYDVTDPQTYINLSIWVDLVSNNLNYVAQNLNTDEVKVIIIGNKIDLDQQRKIPLKRARQQYEQRIGIKCFETSAKTNVGIKQSITYLIEQIQKVIQNLYCAPPSQLNPPSFKKSGSIDSLDEQNNRIIVNKQLQKRESKMSWNEKNWQKTQKDKKNQQILVQKRKYELKMQKQNKQKLKKLINKAKIDQPNKKCC